MRGFSRDGFITDQNALKNYRYRGMTSDVNGCGWVAAYNLRRALGSSADFDAVRREMNAMFPLQIPGPTPMWKLRRYLKRYIPFRVVRGKRAALAAAERSRCGILRYWEGKTPHFITFLRQPDGRFRFLNVSNGREDFVAPMEAFFAKHCRRGWIRVVVDEQVSGE